jgi:Bacterial Ig-like domain (group 2)./Electron transfer DM13.
MRTIFYPILLMAVLTLHSCIGDDFIQDLVDPVLRVNNPIDSLAVGSDFQFQALYLNNVGIEEMVTKDWVSSNDQIISITQDGLASALSPGTATITVNTVGVEGDLSVSFDVVAGETTTEATAQSRFGTIRTTTFYDLEGEFELSQQSDGVLLLEIDDSYQATAALPGLFIYLSNNPNSISGAFEIGAVEVFRGAHNYEIEGVGLNDFSHLLYFCKPFNVKVGDGEIEG